MKNCLGNWYWIFDGPKLLLQIADPLIDARPVGGRPSYIHVIDMELATPAAAAAQNSGASSGRLSFDPSGYSRFWGVLSTKPMPKVSQWFL